MLYIFFYLKVEMTVRL